MNYSINKNADIMDFAFYPPGSLIIKTKNGTIYKFDKVRIRGGEYHDKPAIIIYDADRRTSGAVAGFQNDFIAECTFVPKWN